MKLHTDFYSKELAKHYRHFNVSERLLFTGHSHQAWPDIAMDAMVEAFQNAATRVDDKWNEVFERIEVMRRYLRTYYDDPSGYYTHGENTHNLIVRWMSGLNWKPGDNIVTSDSEFYSLYRQLKRFSEDGLEIRFVHALPLKGFSERVKSAISDRTAAVMISRVYFESGLINNEIAETAMICRNLSKPLIIDDYHGTNVVPLSVSKSGLEDVYILVGGYKYLQWGEGNCFLRYPIDCTMRPSITGWFAAFSDLKNSRSVGNVTYDGGDMRFSGATFDGVSAFRGSAVVRFFENMGLTPSLLAKMYREQIAFMKYTFKKLDFDPKKITLAHDYPLSNNGGFLAFRSSRSMMYYERLKELGVLTDCRGEILRFGVAPYITSDQITAAMEKLKTVVEKV